MPLDTSAVDRALLAHSPLTSVICQIRFDSTPGASDAHTIQALRSRLGGEDAYPHLEEFHQGQMTLSLGPGAPGPQQMSARGWRLRTADGGRVVALLPSWASLEAFRYEGWEHDFAPALAVLLSAVTECVSPVFEQRLGLRYINQITVPDNISGAHEWRGYIDPAFLALAAHDEIGEHVRLTRQQSVLELEPDVRCTVNHGFAPDDERDGALTYILDFDVFREGMRSFDEQEIREAADRFNLYALRLFQLATTADLRGLLT